MKSWAEVEASPEFSALPAAEQDAARQQYFVQVVAPKVPEQDLEIARAQFDKATRIRKQDMAPDIAPSTAGAGRGMAARGVPTLGEQIGAGLASLGDAPAPVRAGPRRGGLRSEVQPYVAADPGKFLGPSGAQYGNQSLEAATQPGASVLDRPGMGGNGLSGTEGMPLSQQGATMARARADMPTVPTVDEQAGLERGTSVQARTNAQVGNEGRAADFKARTEGAAQFTEKTRSRSASEFGSDIAQAGLEGIGTAEQILANVAAPDSEWAATVKKTIEAIRADYTPQKQFQDLQRAEKLKGVDGEWQKAAVMLGELFSDPAFTIEEIVKQAPLMAGMIGATLAGGAVGAGAARVSMAAASRVAPTVALADAIGGGALTASAITAGGAAGTMAAGRVAGGFAAAGDAGSQVFDQLSDKQRTPDAILLDNADFKKVFQENLTRGMDGRQALDAARTTIATSRARLAQALAAPLGVFSGSVGLEKVLAYGIRGQAKSQVVKEVGVEVVEEIGTSGAGNVAARTVDPRQQLTEWFGEAGALALVTSAPLAGLTAYYSRAETPLPPIEARNSTLKRFDEAAAAWGLSPKAAEAVRAQAGAMPADDVPGFLARATAALNRRGLFRRPVDEVAVADLDRRLRPAEAEKPAPQPPTPEADYTGLDTPQEQPDVTQPDLAAAAGVPAGASDGGSDLGGGGGDAVGSAVDGDGRMGGPAADPAPGSGETAAVGTGRGPDAPLTPAPSKFTPEQALARMERQAAEDNQRRGDAPEFEDREATDILGPKGTAWAAKVGANKRLRELGSGYRLARVSTGWVIKPEAQTEAAPTDAAAPQQATETPRAEATTPTAAAGAAEPATVVPGATAAGTAVEGDGVADGALAAVPFSAFNGDMATGLDRTFLSEENDGSPVPLNGQGFTDEEVAALEAAGLATNGRMSREQWGRYSKEKSLRDAGGRGSSVKQAEAADAQTLADAKRRAEERRSKRPAPAVGDLPEARRELRTAMGKVDAVNAEWESLYRDGLPYFSGDGPSRKLSPNAPDALKARYAAFKAAKKEAQRAYDDALAKVNAATPAAAPAPVAPAPATEAPAPAPKPRQLNGSDAEKARALFTPPAAAAAPFPAGSRVTIDGTPYTVTKAGEAIVTLTGDDGKKRAVQTKSATFGKIKAAADAAAPAVTQAPAVSAEASEAAAPGLDSEPRGGVLPPGFRGMTWREAVDKIVAEHGRAAYIDGNSLMYPSGRQGQSNGIGNIPKDVLDYATEALKPKPTTGVDWWDEEQAPPTSASTDEAQDPHASEKENLKRIKEISERQKLGLHTDHMRSDGLAATGWSAESAENAAKAMIPPVVRGMSEAAQKSVAALRERVTDVRYAPTDGATNDITFKFDGKPMIGALRGRNSDAVLRGKDAEGDRALAVRILLDGDAKAAPAAPTQPKTLKERREAAKQAQKAAQPAPGTEAAAPASDQQVPPATAKPPKQTTPPDLSTRVGMVKALKKLGYDASDLDAARTRIPNWGRVGVKLNTIPFKIDMVVELKNERWQFSALESEAPQSISQQEEIAKFKADFAKLIEPAKRAAQAFAPQPVAEPPAAPAAQPATAATHKDPGEPAEPVTPAVVREAIKTAAENTDRTRSEMKAEALRLIDAAIAKAPTAREANAGNPAPKKVTIKVPGDGVFTVVNTEERLKEFRRQIELSPGFKDKLPTYPIGKAVSGGNYGPDQLAREMLEDGEPVNAVEVLEAAGKTMMFGNGNGASIPYTNAEPVEVAGIDDLFVGRGFGTKKGATSWWSVVHKGSGFAIGGSAGSKAEAISEAKKLLGQPEKREKMRALIESGKSADGKAFMTQDELREQFMTEAEGKQQATFNANDASIGLAADRKKREAERDAFYKSIMGDAGLERPAKADWTASSIKEFLDAAEKKGEGEAALKFMDDVVSEYASPHIAEWKKSYDRRNKPSDTGWMTGFQAPGGLRRIRRDVKHPDGTTYRAELDELAGAYVTGKVEQWTSEDGRPRTVQTYSNDMDARAKADRFLDSVVALRKPNPGAALANSPELQSEAEFGAIKQAQAIAEAEREVERVKTNYVSDWRYKSKAAALRGAEADLKNVRESKPENFAGDHLAAINRAIAQGKMPSAENIRRYDIPASQLPKAAEPEAPALDLMGFERIPKGNGAFELRDSNMLVRVEPTDRGKYRASMGSGKSGPNMTEQQAVEWAAAYRAESLRVQAADAKKAATPAPQAAEPEAPANDMRGYAWALVKDGKVIRSGSLPSPQFAPESEDTKLSYYKDMADKAGADLHIGGYPGAAAWAPQEGLIFGMTWDELKARQQKDGRAGSAPEGKMPKDAVLAYSPAAPAAAPAEAPGWHTPLPTQGEPSTQHDRTNAVNPKSPVDARKVSARLAAEAFAAITQAQQTNLAVSGMKLYPWVLPAQGNRNGVVRLLPEDQRPGAPWQQVGAEPVNAGGVRNLAINDLAARLGRAPIIGDEASAARDTFYESLIGKASTEQMSSSGGRTIYSVKITPLMASRQGVEFGRWPETENFALKRMADVTGRPADEGWALIDKREQAASRAAAQPVKAKEGATTNLNKPRAVPKKQALTPGGSLKADATNSRADSAVWYYQGDMGRLRFTASVTIDGKPDLGAAQAKELLAQIKAAQDAGWKRANYRAGSLGTVWVYERGDEFLTRAGMENAGSDVTAWPDIPSYGAGYDNMVRGQQEFAAALDRWLNTLPYEQQQNQGVVSRKMDDVLGGWAGIERDKIGLHVRYYPRQDDGRREVRWLHTIPASQTWEEARAKIAEMAGQAAPAETSEAAAESPAAPPTKTPTVDAHLELFKAVRAGTATPDEFKAMYRRVRDGKDAIVAELNTSTKDELLKGTSGYLRPGTTKGDLVDMIYKGLLSRFALGKEYGPQGFFMGQEKAYEKAKIDALDALVEGQTAESLAEYAAEAKAEFDAEIARRTKLMESVEDPKTLEDFRNFMRVQGAEGKTFAEARMMLTPEQRAAFDELAATETRSKRATAKDDQRTQVRVAGQTVDGEIIATKHTRDGHDLYVVRLAERVSTEDYRTLLDGAKRIGGTYSSYRGNGAVPGFQFRTREAAQAFQKLAQGDNAAAVDAAKERRDAFQDDRSQSAAERLTEMADRLEERADESLGRERQANTERRARFAASAEAAAQSDKALAKTMRNIAGAIEAGTAKFLDRVRQKVQVELLQTYVRSAKDSEIRAKHDSYHEQEKRKGEAPTGETADYAEFPTFTAYRSDLASLGRQLLDVDGTKLFGQRLMKVADDVSDAYLAFAKEPGNLFKLSTFSVRSGEDVRTAIFPSREGAERAIKRSGLTAKAIAFQEKRGVHRIIMSPSLAMEQGIWKGDGDKRITLDPDFAAELVEKMGRANRRGAKVSVPWQFESAYDRRKSLARMGIETPAEFRAALREFIGLREQAAAPDKVKQMERAMIGRRNDGLDFFPTPEETADAMVSAADIQPGMRVLEPSAGMGHIAERIREAGFEPEVGEVSNDRRELLEAKGFNLVGRDFMEFTDANQADRSYTYGDVFRAPDGTLGVMRGSGGMGSDRVRLQPLDADGNPDARRESYQNFADLQPVEKRGVGSGYDRILMNPPFSEGRDIQHVRHAYDLLKPGGRLVALMGESAFTNQNKRATEFREWLESVGGTEEKLAEGTFNDPSLPVNTGANARMVVIDKPGAEPTTQFSRSQSTPRGLSLDEAEAIVGAVREANPTAPPMIVLESVDQAPSALRRDIEEAGAANDVEAAYHEGKVYVFAPHLKSMERAMFVIAHHELRHHGMRSLEGRRLSTVLAGMVMSNPNLRDAARAKMDAGLAKDMIQGAEEALADMDVAEVQALKGWPKVLAAVRNWLRGMATRLRANGHTTLADAIDPKDWTDADVAGFVSRAEAVSKGGRAKFGTDGTVFAQGADQTNMPAFLAWFGSSKVVDAAGKPLVVYHGTSAKAFTKFDTSAEGAHFGTSEQAAARLEKKRGGGGRIKTMAVYLSLQNPLRLPDIGVWSNFNNLHRELSVNDHITPKQADAVWDAWQRTDAAGWQALKDALSANGYDSIVYQNEVEGRGDSYIAFRPEQIKSAIGNTGAFDGGNPDIRYSRAPRVTQDTHDGAPVFASDDITIAFPQDTERFEVIPGDGERVVNYAIMPAQGFDVLGHVELLIRDGKPVSLLDIEVTPAGRRAGTGRKVIETLLAANPDADLNISNIVQDARGFWERMGVPQQNLEQGAAYDGTLNWETYAQAQVANGPRAAAAQGREAGTRSDARAEGTGRGSAGEASGLTGGGTAFSRSSPEKQARTAEKTAKSERAELSSALTAAGNSVRGVRLHAGYVAGDFLGKNLGRLHWWYRSVGTPYNLAQREPQFKPVFDAIQTFLHDVSHYATEAADLAPTILPKLDRARDILKGPMKAEDAKAVAAPVFEGTLGWLRTADGDPIKVEEAEAQAASMSADEKAQELLRSKLLNPKVLRMWQGLPIEQYEQAIETRYASQVLRPGVVWSDAELRSMFKLTEPQIGFYKEFRAATDKSLDDLTVSAMLRVAGDDVSDIRAQVLEQNDMNAAAETIRDRLFELAGEQPDRADELNAAGNNIIDMADRVQDLKDRGYAPLSRFGGLTLDVVTPDGERQYFGMFETKRERNRKLREMRENFPDARITMGTTSEQEFKQFAGVTPETLELFGDVLGMTDEQGKDQLFQEYIRKAKSNRSGLKRLIHRKGVPGFSEDIGRVLASFVYSNARQTSSNLHAGTAEKAIEDISQENGNLKDYAIELNGYVRNPQEEAQALRSMMFAQFLGGSIASAMVNMTQPFNVTFPYLSQYGGPAKAAAQMAKALPDVGRKMFPKDPGLTRALRLAEEAGIVSPQEVFHLQAQAGGKAQLQTGDGTMIGNAGARVNNSLSRLSLIWGRPFAFAEQFNRRLTFIAAYRTAVEQGIGEPAEFASQAVEATQFVYNKGNRPPWARGAAGALLFTFKTYSISMMELMTRALKTPEGRRAALLMLGMVVLMAGIDGLPFMEDMEDVIDGFAQRVLDKNWSTKIERNRLIAQGMMSVFGESSGAHVAEFLARGLSGMPGAPIDVSGRLGLHNLIPGTGIFLKKDGYGRDVADIAGPAGSFAGRVFEAGGQLLSGQPVKAAITASPLAVANIKKAADMATTGFYPDTRGNMVVRTTLGDAVSKGIGFQPNTVAKVQELTFQQQRIVSLARMVETEIVATIATARVKKDEDAEAAAWKRLDGWNKKNPDSPISITNAQLVNAERRMTTEKSVRMLKSAPRDLRPGLANALKPLEPAEAGR